MRLISIMSWPLLVTLVVATGSAGTLDPRDVAKMLDPSVVRIFVVGPNRVASGTGFVINRDGHVVTNFHVVQRHVESGWDMFIAEGGVEPEHRLAASVVEAFPGEDLAILRVDALDRPPVRFAAAEDDQPAKGLPVFSAGFPGAGDRLGPVAEASFAPGTVSRLFPGSWSDAAPIIRIIQHTAPTNPGNSGGPLVNACGHVIGVNTQREVALVMGPGGIPLATDTIQGVFFSSHVSVLLPKLEALGIRFTRAKEACKTALGGPSGGFYIYLAAVALLAVATAVFTLLFRPRPVVQVVVRCGELIDECVCAVESAIRRLGRGGGSAGLRPPADSGSGWALSGLHGDGRPVLLALPDDELRRGLVIGRSRFRCDRILADPSVSPRHARVVALGLPSPKRSSGSAQAGDGLGIVDLNSANGTMVDGRRLGPRGQPTPLRPGSRVRLGAVELSLSRR